MTVHTKFYDLTPEQIQQKNEETFERITVNGQRIPEQWIDGDDAAEIAGIERVYPEERPVMVPVLDNDGNPVLDSDGNPKEQQDTDNEGNPLTRTVTPPYQFSFKPDKKSETEYYKMVKQGTNRPISLDNMNLIADMVMQGRYCLNGETMICDQDGDGISLQHRCGGIFLAFKRGWDKKVPILLVEGVDNSFADTADTGRARTGKDQMARDPDIVPESEIRTIQGKTFGDKQTAIRTKIVGITESAAKLAVLRSQGRDINGSLPSKTVVEYEMRFLRVVPLFDDLCQLVFKYDVGPTGSDTKWSKVGTGKDSVPFVGRQYLAAAIALYQLRDESPFDVIGNSTKDLGPQWDTVEEKELDMEEAEHIVSLFCKASAAYDVGETESTPDNPFLSLYSAVVGKNEDRRQRPARQYLFAYLVRGFKQYAESGITDNSNAKITRGKFSASDFPHFGGVDRGPVAKKKKSSDNE